MKSINFTKIILCLFCCLLLNSISAQQVLDLKGCGQSSAKYLVKVNIDAVGFKPNSPCPADESSIVLEYTQYLEKEIDGPIEKIEYIEQCVGGNWFWGPGGIKITHKGGRETFMSGVGNSVNLYRELNNVNNMSTGAKIVSIKRVDGVEEPDCFYGMPEPENYFIGCSRNCIRYRTNAGEWKATCVELGGGDEYRGTIPRVDRRVNTEGDVVFDLYLDPRTGGEEMLIAKDLIRFPEVERGYDKEIKIGNSFASCGWKSTGLIATTQDGLGDRKGGCVVQPMTLGQTDAVVYCSKCSDGKKMILRGTIDGVTAAANVFIAVVTGGKGAIVTSGVGAIIISSNKDGMEGAICDPPTARQANVSLDKENPGIITDELSKELLAFPNPAKDHIYFNYQFTSGTQLNVTISDLMGKQVFDTTIKKSDSNIHKESINIAHLAPGVYVLNITEGGKNIKQTKFVVQ